MKLGKAFKILVGIFIAIFLVYSFYIWWLDTPWRNRWKDLMRNLDNYVTKDIELKGNVVEPYTIAGVPISVYTLEFENYKCTVISTTGIPAEGSEVIVRGKVKKNYKVETVFQGRKISESFPWVILEEERREKD
ncbi:MAG: hypothetical protein CBR30_08330 [Dictyoglomus sp. NZ13-RE01]|nr:MAG: hypothetical protein CBR30_08330 [Dictyoglomus sp. NZ13-RE01]